ncbi:two-component system sensor histidine kinase VanS [Microbacterium sp. W4I4]|uniref:sensor histidine kinase n=1 Tax=Microbacterium sp. W4I4 TaxID=3042295 RepID=UPI002786DA34|nr:HAMP domain-containing sensor histidine kinase [Microbacterium sp. W4I4]MDQ0614364.1 two-component system sensor histidine kinase VanS [Microbacterium sp. W4I4]
MTQPAGRRRRGVSARMKLTLSYAGAFGMAGALLVAAGWAVVLLRRFFGPLDELLHAAIPWQVRQFLMEFIVPGSVIVIVLLTGFGFLIGWFVAGRMLAPLTRIGEAARLASQGSLSHRVALEGKGDEFRDLADVFDTMLERLEGHMAEQQRFAANASHELRTPLAIMRTQIEVAQADPDRDVDALLARLHQVNGQAIELTEALLLMARADGQAFERARVDLSLLAEEAVETLLPMAERRGITIESKGDPAHVTGSPALLQQLITNLVHNAIVHNLPAAGMIGLRVSAMPTGVVLAIANTGPAVEPELLATLTEPFQRGAGRTRRADTRPVDVTGPVETRGLGLGLAIVQSIVRAHGATLQLTARPGGGLLVEAWFPRAG